MEKDQGDCLSSCFYIKRELERVKDASTQISREEIIRALEVIPRMIVKCIKVSDGLSKQLNLYGINNIII